MMAPSILDQLDKGDSKTGGIVLHDGQQYISFVDSRQAAAKATFETESGTGTHVVQQYHIP